MTFAPPIATPKTQTPPRIDDPGPAGYHVTAESENIDKMARWGIVDLLVT
jgi:hypothetical protein